MGWVLLCWEEFDMMCWDGGTIILVAGIRPTRLINWQKRRMCIGRIKKSCWMLHFKLLGKKGGSLVMRFCQKEHNFGCVKNSHLLHAIYDNFLFKFVGDLNEGDNGIR